MASSRKDAKSQSRKDEPHMRNFETVYTVMDYYDGPRTGTANLNGTPYHFDREYDEINDDWSDTYLLTPMDSTMLRDELEIWQIWLRWKTARDSGLVTLESHPALPEDRQRFNELQHNLKQALANNKLPTIRARASFSAAARNFAGITVCWSIVE
jgi:hypothetical protein